MTNYVSIFSGEQLDKQQIPKATLEWGYNNASGERGWGLYVDAYSDNMDSIDLVNLTINTRSGGEDHSKYPIVCVLFPGKPVEGSIALTISTDVAGMYSAKGTEFTDLTGFNSVVSNYLVKLTLTSDTQGIKYMLTFTDYLTDEDILDAATKNKSLFYHSLGWWPSNKNLLDNADFRNKDLVVNQRAQLEYTVRDFMFDRWHKNTGQKVAIENDGILVSDLAVHNDPNIRQYLGNKILVSGQTYTASCLVEKQSGDGEALTIGVFTDTWQVKSIPYSEGKQLYFYTFVCNAEVDNPLFTIWTNNTISKYYIAKLELGTEQTLAHQEANGDWVLNDPSPQDYASELVKCQRYLMPMRGDFFYNCSINEANTVIHIPLDLQNMVKTPNQIVVAKMYDLGLDIKGARLSLSYPTDFAFGMRYTHLGLVLTSSGKTKTASYANYAGQVWARQDATDCNVLLSAEL